jgi:hypothetical protein
MTTTINASPSNGIVQTADGSGVMKLQSNGVTTNALAWVNFNGTTSPGTINSQYNVSSVTRNGTGDYTLNFTAALSDANYSCNFGCTIDSTALATNPAFVGVAATGGAVNTKTTSALRIYSYTGTTFTLVNSQNISVSIFGN